MKEIGKEQRVFSQGDITFVRVNKTPKELKEVKPTGGKHILAHSETGHHHTVDAAGLKLMQGDNPMVCFLVSERVTSFDVVHGRNFDTHETYRVACDPGETFARIRQREWSPWGDRMVAD